MTYPIFNAMIAFSSLTITKDRNIFSSCPARIETLSIVSPASMLNPAKAINRFFAVRSASARSLL
jgi:hypothetical protein